MQAFGKYQLIEPVAEGGMAVVWRAKIVGPSGFEKEFCVKQIKKELAERREFVELFVAEAKLTVSLTHANIVPVYELGMVDGTYFLALEMIDGPPLSELTRKGPLPASLAAYIVEQVLRGLDYAHRRGVVHRDLSPANVLVSRDGEVKIVDFGIAGVKDEKAVHGGSRGYMAPEQEAGGHVDARSDLFAVGVLLRELSTGRRDESLDGVDEGLRAIVLRATSDDPADRYADAGAMLAHVSRWLRDLSMGPTQSELSEWVRKRCPSLPRAPTANATGPRAANGTGPRTVPVEGRQARSTGPHTAPVGKATGKQITFATRIQLDEPPPRRRALYLGAAALALAGAVGVTVLARGGDRPALRRAVVGAPAPVAPTHPVSAPRPPSLAKLEVTTTPAGAEVRAGDKLLGTTPLSVELPPGSLELHLRKAGFQPIDRTIEKTAFAGTPPSLSIKERLQPVERGLLTLNARPWAHVTIDGEKRPDTPIQKLALPAGKHSVRLVCPPTGRELRFTVVVEPDAEVRRIADLRGEPRLVDD